MWIILWYLLKHKIIKKMIIATPKAKCHQCRNQHKSENALWSDEKVVSWILSNMEKRATWSLNEFLTLNLSILFTKLLFTIYMSLKNMFFNFSSIYRFLSFFKVLINWTYSLVVLNFYKFWGAAHSYSGPCTSMLTFSLHLNSCSEFILNAMSEELYS
jgi:hypothetical protein